MNDRRSKRDTWTGTVTSRRLQRRQDSSWKNVFYSTKMKRRSSPLPDRWHGHRDRPTAGRFGKPFPRQSDRFRVSALAEITSVRVERITPPVANRVPHALIHWDESRIRVTPAEMKAQLAAGKPSIATARHRRQGISDFRLYAPAHSGTNRGCTNSRNPEACNRIPVSSR